VRPIDELSELFPASRLRAIIPRSHKRWDIDLRHRRPHAAMSVGILTLVALFARW
jgi:hypothetical protein